MILIHQRHRQTDGQTDRRTDGQLAISIPRYALVHRAVKMRDGPHNDPLSVYGSFYSMVGWVTWTSNITATTTQSMNHGRSLSSRTHAGGQRSIAGMSWTHHNTVEMVNSQNANFLTFNVIEYMVIRHDPIHCEYLNSHSKTDILTYHTKPN